jgi:hypothetical protein
LLRPTLPAVIAGLVALVVCPGCGERDEELHRPVVTPEGKSVIETVESGQKQTVVRDGKRIGSEYERVFPPVLSPDGESVAFVAKTDDGHVIVKDGKAIGEPASVVLHPTYSPSGKSFAYAEPRGQKGRDWCIVRDGKPVGGRYDYVGAPTFSPDGSSIAFAAKKGDKTYVARDGELTGPGHDDVRKLGFAPDGGALVYVVVDFETGEQRLMRAGKPVSPEYERIWGWAAGPDGRSLAWVARRDGQEILLKDGTEVGEPFTANEVVGPVFATDGAAVGLAVGHGTWSLRKDDARLGDPFEADYVRQLLFSPDGESLACSAVKRGAAFVVKNGLRVGGTYRAVSELKNSADGAHLEFHALVGGRKEQVRVPW